MTPETVIGLWREAMFLIVIMVAVIVMPSLLVGLAVRTFQAATQINAETLRCLPSVLTNLMMISISRPWLLP